MRRWVWVATGGLVAVALAMAITAQLLARRPEAPAPITVRFERAITPAEPGGRRGVVIYEYAVSGGAIEPLSETELRAAISLPTGATERVRLERARSGYRLAFDVPMTLEQGSYPIRIQLPSGSRAEAAFDFPPAALTSAARTLATPAPLPTPTPIPAFRGPVDEWTRLGLEQSILAVAVSPEYPQDATVFAVATKGLWRSDNGGGTWQQLPDLPGGFDGSLTLIMTPNYAHTRTVLLVSRNGLLRSANAGVTWEWLTRWQLPTGEWQDGATAVAASVDSRTTFLGGPGGLFRFVGEQRP